jgi:nicotinate-nucleotide adenylyltransferase
MTSQVIPVFGGAFDPVHMGHVSCVHHLLEMNEKVLVVPSVSHAFGKTMTSFEHRLVMLNLIFAKLIQEGRVEILDVEKQLKQDDKPVYSYNVLKALKPAYSYPLKLAIGYDNAQPDVFAKFYKAQEILSEFGLIVVQDQGGERSTLYRKLLKMPHDTPMVRPLLERMLSSSVLEYIDAHQLYKG